MRTRIKSNRICIAYPNGIVQFFMTILLCIIMISCSSHSEREAASELTNNTTTINSELITDDAFINDLNSFDSTAVINDLYLDNVDDFTGNTYAIVIKQNDSLFIYKGKGTYMRRYFSSLNIGDFAKH